MRKALLSCLLVCLPAAAQEIPTATALPGDPFFIKQTWPIGGAGNWDHLTVDPTAQRLYISHGAMVQVVDIESGTVVTQILGFREARSIVLDDTGSYAYIGDGQADAVRVIDRRSFTIEATIPIGCSPRSAAFEPQSRLLFAICGATVAAPAVSPPANWPAIARNNRSAHSTNQTESTNASAVSRVVAIDTDKRRVVVSISVAGDFRSAQADGDGHVYVSVGVPDTQRDAPRIARLDSAAIVAETQRRLDARPQAKASSSQPLLIDWSDSVNRGQSLQILPLGESCLNPQGLAVDGRHQRLFLACDEQKFLVLDAATGSPIASLTTGPGDDAIAYDRDRGLIFVANGAGYGSLTIIQQDGNTDSYQVIQNLPTRERARTVAVDQSTGQVYLVTNFYGVDLTKPGAIGTMTSAPISGSFHVLVIGH